jgi:hypothetical protein
MAQLVLGIATSHSPQVSIPAENWDLLRVKDETDPRLDYPDLLARAKPDIEQALHPSVWKKIDDGTQKSIAKLGQTLRESRADVVVVLGDDQHEQFMDDNLPMFAVYHGKTVPVVHHSVRNRSAWKQAEEAAWADTATEYPAAWDLGEHLICSLVNEEFDLARSNRLREEIGVGHAFSFLYRRLLPGGSLPMVPVMVNTYYPPNQPTPRRCYALGQALRRAIASWDSDARVAVMASGGLSHVIIDEEIDRMTIDGLQSKDREKLYALPRERLKGGTSEILNWVALAGAVEPLEMTLLDYFPAYRSPAATGCGSAFAYWK